ncbi:hypothetical protein AVEN_72298-1 [Araneus ventricosus]|uniref:Uncharacterized protein n=1 Tax=Araneus ventricosus TaxID=182803 RepID=A0A4Y2TB19_ARAVE|nr:hypothetical protein AVEN_72298-1 [Araneus ventricosus]
MSYRIGRYHRWLHLRCHIRWGVPTQAGHLDILIRWGIATQCSQYPLSGAYHRWLTFRCHIRWGVPPVLPIWSLLARRAYDRLPFDVHIRCGACRSGSHLDISGRAYHPVAPI